MCGPLSAYPKMRGQDIANKVLPGLGYAVAFFDSPFEVLRLTSAILAGASMGLNIVFGIDTTTAAAISGIFGILLFASPKMGGVLDNTAKVLGTVMLVLIGYVAFSTNPSCSRGRNPCPCAN